MSWLAFTDLLAAAAQSPLVIVACAFAVFVAGLVAGFRLANDHGAVDHELLAPMRTANSSLIDLQSRRLQHQAGIRPRARAGDSPVRLKPSYDGRPRDAAANPSHESPRG